MIIRYLVKFCIEGCMNDVPANEWRDALKDIVRLAIGVCGISGVLDDTDVHCSFAERERDMYWIAHEILHRMMHD